MAFVQEHRIGFQHFSDLMSWIFGLNSAPKQENEYSQKW